MGLKFDAYEYNGVIEYEDCDGERYCEPVTEDQLADWQDQGGDNATPVNAFWSVYGHLPEGGVECLCDCATEDDARRIYEALTTVLAMNGEGQGG